MVQIDYLFLLVYYFKALINVISTCGVSCMNKTKMKEIYTPLKLFKIRYYIDENGVYYKKVGTNHRKRVKPFWKKKRVMIGIPVLFVFVIGGYFTYKIGMDFASKKVVNEISSQVPKEEVQKLLEDPAVQEIIEKEIGQEKKQEILNKYAVVNTVAASSEGQQNATGAAIPVTNTSSNGNEGQESVTTETVPSGNSQVTPQTPPKEEPKLRFNSREEVMKFLLSKFSMRELNNFAKMADGGITAEEKSEIKADVMKKLSQEEYNALKLFGILEISKGNI
jgi:hypothetical protein